MKALTSSKTCRATANFKAGMLLLRAFFFSQEYQSSSNDHINEQTASQQRTTPRLRVTSSTRLDAEERNGNLARRRRRISAGEVTRPSHQRRSNSFLPSICPSLLTKHKRLWMISSIRTMCAMQHECAILNLPTQPPTYLLNRQGG
mmetsp:Transcript_8382/g.24148  ORF Transcript_8382/g.24148 Transcript_8382/m.24148 type:complete len:146 (+) Transcript_8382:2394-2831(+)